MPQNPWDVPIGQPQAQPVADPGVLEKLLKSLFGGQPAPAPTPAAPPQGGPVFSGEPLDELAQQIKKQKQIFALTGGQIPPQ